jgi:hypothetical protein
MRFLFVVLLFLQCECQSMYAQDRVDSFFHAMQKNDVKHIGYRTYGCESDDGGMFHYYPSDSDFIKYMTEHGFKKSEIRKTAKLVRRQNRKQARTDAVDCTFTNSTIYVFWQKGNAAYIKKFNDCGESYPVKMKYQNIFECPDKYGELMKTEELKMFTTDDSFWTRGVRATAEVSFDHDCYSYIFLLNNEDTISRTIGSIDRDSIFLGMRNFSYRVNNDLKMVVWDKQLASIIADLEKRKKLKQQK